MAFYVTEAVRNADLAINRYDPMIYEKRRCDISVRRRIGGLNPIKTIDTTLATSLETNQRPPLPTRATPGDKRVT